MSQSEHRLPDGVFAAALTPMRADLTVDHAALAAHCRWLLANGCDAIAPLGTTGEANSLALGERIELLERLVADGLPAARLLVGTGCCALPDTVALTRHALALGAGGVLVLPPFYYKNVSDDGLYAFYDRVVQQVGDTRLSLYLYHFPQMTGVPLSLALIDRLLRAYPRTIAGMKDSGGDVANMRAACESFPGFRVYAGTERHLLDVLRAGGAGCISATVNVTAPLAGAVYAAWRGPQADALQARASAARAAIERFPVIAALKRILAERSGRADWLHLRPPLVPLSDDAARALRAALGEFGIV